MIASFKDSETQAFAATGRTKRGWQTASSIAMRKIDALRAAAKLDDLRAPPGNMLEMLSGNRKGQHSTRINKQWRICFRWTENGAEDVEITDYHKG
jgi:toxin HigB-1